MKAAIEQLINHQDLSYQESYQAVKAMMSGQVSQAQMAAYLTALAIKGASDQEIAGSAAAMRDQAKSIDTQRDTLEIVGTGGDQSYSFNISTTASLIIAAAGVPVTKHGNRSASSKSGAADCIEALGINLYQDPDLANQLLDQVGICFLFAQNYHLSMKNVSGVRQDLGIKTIFNILGPITNPAKPKYQVLGVYQEDLIHPMAKVIKNLGVERGLVIYGQDGMDEISISAPTSALFFDCDYEESFTIKPEDYGFPNYQKADIVGGTPADNAQITIDILTGQEHGAKRDITLLNAAAGLYAARKVDSLDAGIELARQIIDSGAAYQLLQDYISASQEGVTHDLEAVSLT
ncbi:MULTISPECIES: anthranilate phosphoribosyltransferase [Aerococcus]|nr:MULTISPECIES: anthranilate phosphoribosyltransferase [Aerococcus]MCY3025629.1 anthranilate phosphoribosyltransferase [Aerococcus loyolae]MCY3027276.1 anthranilate phosphoribosyltransferase [Aerococcus loyolae]MCY3028898.1 anthranilate phosphoribosyltransferase [Aerococcus loyolae]MDK6232297.1 anthranilate phosphoribosyltransferase [Aerococcus urinae]MDK6257452.1 anthranilate phosphoribosyltransferase [Aerococcus urinae]